MNPLVSIVLLTKNGGNLFQDVMRMLFSQKVEFSYEVIIVDSGSKDGTLEFLREYPVKIFKIAPEDFCYGPTRHFGFCQAQGEYIVTLSQDVVPIHDQWLQNLVSPLINDEADVVQGYDIPPENRRIFFWEKIRRFYFTSEGSQFIKSNGGFGISFTNLAVKKKAWQAAHFERVPMNEDKVLQQKLLLKGFRIIAQKEASATHGHNYNLSSLIKRCENEGMGWRYVGVKYSFRQMVSDIAKMQRRWVYGIFVRGVLNREIRSPAEFFFLLIRPICLYKGNLLNQKCKF